MLSVIRQLRLIRHKTKALLERDSNRFLRQVSGVIHIGANSGQERDLYDTYGLRVLWVEPIPEVFEILKTNIKSHPRQRAFQYLVTDRSEAQYCFHIANNDGASSSILDFKLHGDIWPSVAFDRTISLKSTTMPDLLKREEINLREYDALILDTQGSELLILKGAIDILPKFRFIKIEVPDFESYEGCCELKDVAHFLGPLGFREIERRTFAERIEGGSYYDVVYKRGWLNHQARMLKASVNRLF